MKKLLIFLLSLSIATSYAQTPLPASRVQQDATHRFSSDSQQTNWNGKLSPADTVGKFVGKLSGYRLLSPAEITKLTALPADAINSTYADSRYVLLSGGYLNPSWIASLAWPKITGLPSTLSGYGITDGVSTLGSYANPAWLSSLAWTKITGTATGVTAGTYGSASAIPQVVVGTDGRIQSIANVSVSIPPSVTNTNQLTNGSDFQTGAQVLSAIGSTTIATRSGSVIAFDQSAIYNTASSPATGNITFDLSGAVVNRSVTLFHQQSSTPTFPSSTTVLGTYYPNNLNEIRLTYLSATEVVAVIRNSNSSGYVNPETIYIPTADVSTTGTTGIAITGMNITILANTRYVITGMLGLGSDNTGGVNLGTNWTSTPTSNEILFFGRTTGQGVFTSSKTDNTNGYNAVFTGGAAQFGQLASANNWVTVTGEVVGGTSDATLTILFASAVSGQTSTIYKKRTFLKVTKL